MSPIGETTQTGTTSFEFPLTIYDRPSIAMANLLSGNIDATTRAIFSPMTLAPKEVKSIRNMLLKGEAAENPLIKTAVDLATNPMVIIGLILMMGTRGKVASLPEMHAIFNEGQRAMKGLGPLMRSLSSSFTALRPVWHLPVMKAKWSVAKDGIVRPLEAMLELVRRTSIFNSKGVTELKILQERFRVANGSVALTRAQHMLTSLYIQGMHKTPRIIRTIRTVRGEKLVKETIMSSPFQGAYRKLFGTTAPLMPRLPEIIQKESPAFQKYITGIQRAYKRWGEAIFLDPSGKLNNVMEAKGVRLITEDFGPQIMTRTPIEKYFRGGKGLSGKAYKGIVRRMGEAGALSRHAQARLGHGIPMQTELEFLRSEMLAKHNIELFGPGMWDKYLQIKSLRIEEVRKLFYNLSQTLKRAGTDYAIDPITGNIVGKNKSVVEEVKRQLGETFEILQNRFKMLEGDIGLNEGARALTRELQKAAHLPPAQMDDYIRGLANIVGAPPEYILNSNQIARQYIKAMAPTYAWFKSEGLDQAGKQLPGLGKAFMNSVVGPSSLGVDPADLDWTRRMLVDDLGPMLMGMKNFKEYARAQSFRDTAVKFTRWLQSDSPVVKVLPQATRERWVAAFSGARGSISDATIGGRISSLLYTSALGLNMSPVSKNLLQTPITLLPILGGKNMAIGFKRVADGLVRLPGAAKKYGSMDKAIRKIFPEYYRYFGGEEITKAMATGDIAKEGQIIG